MRLLLAILTCHKFTFRADIQREIWVRQDAGIDIRFFLGRGPRRDPRPDEVFLDCPDDYRNMPAKHREMCRWSRSQDYDFTFRSDDDSFLVLERLLASGFEKHDYTGRLRRASGAYPHPYCSGIGYWLSRKAVDIIASAELPKDHADDRWIGNLLLERGIQCFADYRYGVSRSNRNLVSLCEGPRKGNEIICVGEFASRPAMQRIRDEYLNLPSKTEQLAYSIDRFRERFVLRAGPKMKTFNLITHLTNGAGLQQDYELLRGLIEKAGHKAVGIHFQDCHIAPRADVNIFLEVIVPKMMRQARENWIVPNSEWWYGRTWDRFLPYVKRVLCKTQDAFEIWARKTPGKAVYTGWEARDLYDAEIPRVREFLHLAGKSETKNTAAVTEAWKQFSIPYPLTVVAFKPTIIRVCLGIPNVTHIERWSEDQVRAGMNRFLFQLIPSKYEGFGQYIHEAIGCGSVVITTDAPPMNAFRGITREALIPVEKIEPRLEARFNLVSPAGIRDAIEKALALDEEKLAGIRVDGRSAFVEDRDFFRKKFRELIDAA